MLKVKSLSLLFFILFFVGCQSYFEKSLLPEKEIEYSKEYFELLKMKNFEAVYKPLNDSLKTNENTKKQLLEIAELFPIEKVTKIDVIGSSIFISNMDNKKIWRANLSFQYTYSNSWLLTNINLTKVNDGELVVDGINVKPLRDSLESINKFSLEGKSFIQYLILLLSILIPLFIIFTFIVFIRTPMKKRKWLWGFFILIGLVKFTINWTTGALHINPLSFNLLGSGFFYGNAFAPVVISIGLPIGAILFWFKKKKVMIESEKNI